MTPRDRNLMAAGSLAFVLVGVAGQFSVWWAAIVVGLVGLGAALLLAYGAVR
jgi:hypothetical protein